MSHRDSEWHILGHGQAGWRNRGGGGDCRGASTVLFICYKKIYALSVGLVGFG